MSFDDILENENNPNHALAVRIPVHAHGLFEDIDTYDLNQLFEFMNVALNDQKTLSDTVNKIYFRSHPVAFCVALGFANPNASDEELLNTLTHLNIHPATKILIACTLQREDMVNSLLAEGRASFNPAQLNNILKSIARWGNTTLFQTFIDEAVPINFAPVPGNNPVNNISAEDSLTVLAARYGRQEMLNAIFSCPILSENEKRDMLESHQYEATRQAARFGHLDVLSELAEQYASLGPPQDAANRVFEMFMRKGDRAKNYGSSAFSYGLGNKDVNVVRGVVDLLKSYDTEQFEMNFRRDGLDFLRLAIELGRFDTAVFLLGELKQLRPPIPTAAIKDMLARNTELFTRAARDGNIQMMSWLYDTVDTMDPSAAYNMLLGGRSAQQYAAFKAAAGQNQVVAMEFIVSKLEGSQNAFQSAWQAWSPSSNPVQRMLAGENFEVFETAVRLRHAETLKFIIETQARISPAKLEEMFEARTFFGVSGPLTIFAANGYIETIATIHNALAGLTDAQIKTVFDTACKHGNVDVVHYVFEDLCHNDPQKIANLLQKQNFSWYADKDTETYGSLIQYLLLKIETTCPEVLDRVKTDLGQFLETLQTSSHAQMLSQMPKGDPEAAHEEEEVKPEEEARDAESAPTDAAEAAAGSKGEEQDELDSDADEGHGQEGVELSDMRNKT